MSIRTDVLDKIRSEMAEAESYTPRADDNDDVASFMRGTADGLRMALAILQESACDTSAGNVTLTADHAHVILDAIAASVSRIDKGAEPWTEYEGADDDPKLSEDGYMQLLNEASVAVGPAFR